MFFSTHATPWGNPCALPQGWTIFPGSHLWSNLISYLPSPTCTPRSFNSPFSYNSQGGQVPAAFPGHGDPRTKTRRRGVPYTLLFFEPHWNLRNTWDHTRPASWSPIFFTHLNTNRCWHRYFPSHRSEVKALSKPRELTSQCIHQSI